MDPEYVVLEGGVCDGEIHLVPPGASSLTRHRQQGDGCLAEEFERVRGSMRQVPAYGWLGVLHLTRSWVSDVAATTRGTDLRVPTVTRVSQSADITLPGREAGARPVSGTGMQHRMQSAVLLALADDPVIDRQALMSAVPGADERDLDRALEVLVTSGAVSVDLRSGGAPVLHLTRLGAELLLVTA